MAQRRDLSRMSDTDLTSLERAVANFAEERDWGQFHDPKNLSMALASEVGELAAVLRWIGNAEADQAAADPTTRAKLLQEIGDIGILLIALCNRLGVHLDDAVVANLALNAERYPVDSSYGRANRS